MKQKHSSAAELFEKEAAFRVPSDKHVEGIREYLTALGGARALSVWILLKNQEFDQIAKLECHPSDFKTPRDFRSAYLATHLFAKFQDFKLEVDRKTAARTKFEKFELQCEQTNRRFKNLCSDPKYQGRTVWLHDAVRRKIAKILGPFNPSELLRTTNWGPGASTLIKKSDACAANKFQNETGITRDLFSLLNETGYFSPVSGFSPAWEECLRQAGFPRFYPGNIEGFAPKSSFIDRITYKEPGLNLWFQKGCGEMMRRRLRKCGLDLRTQQVVNQRLALKGSVDGSVATIDFSSASDSIALELVRDLLPPDWFDVLNVVRSHFGSSKLSVKPRLWQKFSSMGNGFTFELETLIFYATSLVCVENGSLDRHLVSVFGDDVILPTSDVAAFLEMASFYGFTVNTSKSFISSAFRESCGEHYFEGVCCKPVYLKKTIRKLTDVMKFHNHICRRSRYSDGRLKTFKRVMKFLKMLVPKELRLLGPASLGDCVFSSNFDEATPSLARDGYEGYRVMAATSEAVKFRFSGEGLLLAALWLFEQRSGVLRPEPNIRFQDLVLLRRGQKYDPVGEDDDTSPLTRKGFNRLRFQVVLVSAWEDQGPWI